MKTGNQIAKLIDAICENFMKALNGQPWAPQTVMNDDKTMTLVTHCNQFVSGVATSLGYTAFANRTADQMCAFVLTSPEWTNIQWDVAQSHANNGAFVIACQSANPHGHVCVIRPGIPLPSGHYGIDQAHPKNGGSQGQKDKSSGLAQ